MASHPTPKASQRPESPEPDNGGLGRVRAIKASDPTKTPSGKGLFSLGAKPEAPAPTIGARRLSEAVVGMVAAELGSTQEAKGPESWLDRAACQPRPDPEPQEGSTRKARGRERGGMLEALPPSPAPSRPREHQRKPHKASGRERGGMPEALPPSPAPSRRSDGAPMGAPGGAPMHGSRMAWRVR